MWLQGATLLSNDSEKCLIISIIPPSLTHSSRVPPSYKQTFQCFHLHPSIRLSVPISPYLCPSLARSLARSSLPPSLPLSLLPSLLHSLRACSFAPSFAPCPRLLTPSFSIFLLARSLSLFFLARSLAPPSRAPSLPPSRMLLLHCHHPYFLPFPPSLPSLPLSLPTSSSFSSLPHSHPSPPSLPPFPFLIPSPSSPLQMPSPSPRATNTRALCLPAATSTAGDTMTSGSWGPATLRTGPPQRRW